MNSYATQCDLLGGDRFVGAVSSLYRTQLLVGQSAAGPSARAPGISVAAERSARDRQAPGRDHAHCCGLLTLKEWAYARLTFAWIAVVAAHYLAKDGAVTLILLFLLFVSYFTRPASRRLGSKAAA